MTTSWPGAEHISLFFNILWRRAGSKMMTSDDSGCQIDDTMTTGGAETDDMLTTQ
jgi:hypothetical protein